MRQSVGYAGAIQPEARKYTSLLRLMGEALAIVLSILLAFAIDAWWQDRAEYRILEPKIEKLLETLNSEIAGRDE